MDGPEVNPSAVNPMLHPWQNDIVRWAVKTRRAAIWADTGLGKTMMQLEWARLSGETCLIVAPLAVCAQTVREAAKLGICVDYGRNGISGPGIWITNYEMIDTVDPSALDAVVLDEASILKQSTGKTRTKLIHHFGCVPARLTCTATPAPNDPEELTNQAEFLGRATRVDMLAAYFVRDTDGWRMKGHARGPMFRWMSSWAVAISKPSDMGYADGDYILPGLKIVTQMVGVEMEAEGQLFATDLGGVGGRARVRRVTLNARCERAAELVAAEPDEPWLLWCGLNEEAAQLAKLTGAVNISGGMSPEAKADALIKFADGSYPRVVTKPSLAAFGLNWQHCASMVFVGLSDSYESYYQSIRRCYRYGQHRVVHAHIVLSELESQIAVNVRRKEQEASHITAGLVEAMRREEMAA
ncbi:MAG: helicase-related protein [Sciscionella sp.]